MSSHVWLVYGFALEMGVSDLNYIAVCHSEISNLLFSHAVCTDMSGYRMLILKCSRRF